MTTPAADIQYDIFIAHASADKAVAEQLFDLLARQARVSSTRSPSNSVPIGTGR